MPRGGDQSKNLAPGKKMGRPPKATIALDDGPTKKGVASQVLAMDGPPPDHERKCPCIICAGEEKKRCECTFLDGDKGGKIKIECFWCRTRIEHRICRCEICGWWQLLTATDRRIVFDSRRYLTDRRDGKPAQGVFIGDTRENRPDLDFGNLLVDPAPPAGESGKTRKPN